jgi:hypothetical protein
MNDNHLIRELRRLDTPIEPRGTFVDDLFGELERERLRGNGRTRLVRPQILQIAAASMGVLIVVAVGWALLANQRGPAVTPAVIASPVPTPAVSPTPSPTPTPTPTPEPTATPQASPVAVWRAGAPPPLEIASFLDSSDGLVWAFGLAEEPAPFTQHELDLMSYDAVADEWLDHGRITYEADGIFPDQFPGVLGPDGDVYLFAAGVDASDTPVAWRIDVGTLRADGPAPEGSPSVTPETSRDGSIYVLETVAADFPEQLPQRLWSYDPVGDAFELLPEIPEDRANSLLVADAEGIVHVIGGTTVPEFVEPDTSQSTPLNTAFRYDPEARTWAGGLASPNFAGTHHAGMNDAALGSDDALYIMSHAGSQRLFRQAPGAEWTLMPTPPEPAENGYVGMQGAAGGQLVLLEASAATAVADTAVLTSGN